MEKAKLKDQNEKKDKKEDKANEKEQHSSEQKKDAQDLKIAQETAQEENTAKKTDAQQPINLDTSISGTDKVELTHELAQSSKNYMLKIPIDEKIFVFSNISEQVLKSSDAQTLVERPLYTFDTVGGVALDLNNVQTPFKVLSEIPRFFELISMKANGQETVSTSKVLHNEVSTISQIALSGEIFNGSTMTVRVKLKEVINGIEIGNVNIFKKGSLKVKEVVSPYETSQTYASLLESRLMMLIKMYQATDSILYRIPSKIVVNSTIDGSTLHRNLSSMTFFEGDYAHIYLSVFLSSVPWYVTALENLYNTAPIILGEQPIETWQSKKMTSEISCVSDQFATAIANLNFFRLQSSRATPSDYVNRVLANMFARDDVRVINGIEDNITSLLYEPSRVEWTLIMYLLIIDKNVRDEMYKRTLNYITASNRFNVYPFESVWDQKISPRSQLSHQVFNSFLLRMSVGNNSSPYELVLLETCSGMFRINLSFPSLPSDFSAVIEILAILLFVNVCPAIAQQTGDQWGYRLRKLLSIYLPSYQTQWDRAYGTIRRGDESYDTYSARLTRSLSQQGWIYSIFSDVAKVSSVNQSYFGLIKRIRELCIPTKHIIELSRKRTAGYPYYSDKYTAYTSLTPHEESELNTDEVTEWVRRLYTALDIVKELVDLKAKKGGETSLPKVDRTWMNTFFDYIESLLGSAASPFQGTMYRIQETLMNSFPFVLQRYDPDKPFNIPQDLVLSPADLYSVKSGISIKPSQINNFDIFSCMRLLLTLEGDFKRNISLATKGVPQSDETLPQPSQNYLMLQGHILDDCALSLLSRARHFGLSMQLLKWILDSEDPANPIRSIAMGIKHLLKVSNWANLSKEIFTHFGLSFEDFFTSPIGTKPGLQDGRGVLLQLRELDAETQRPSTDSQEGTIFGKQVEYTDKYMATHLDILSRILLSSDSPIINLVEGCYLGRFLVDELAPQQVDIEDGWRVIKMFTDGINPKRQITFGNSSAKAGYASSITISMNNTTETYFLPYDKRCPNIMIEIDRFSRIPLSHKSVIAKAIIHGNLALKITKSKLCVNLIDVSSRTVDYSEEKSASELERIISTPDGDIVSCSSLTTLYATNYNMNSHTVPTYIQWIAFMEIVDKNLHAAVLNSGYTKDTNTRFPSKKELEYGVPGSHISRCFSDNISKIDSSIINWNNSYRAIGDGLLSSQAQLEYIPAQPMDFSLFLP